MRHRIPHPILALVIILLTPVFGRGEMQGHPNLAAAAPFIKRIALFPPQIEMFELGAGGSQEKMDDWGQAAVVNVRKALATEFSKREHLQVTDFEPDRLSPSQRDIYNETLLLYELVSGSIVRHAFNVQYAPHQHGLSPFFPEKARDFTFSLGKELSDLASDVDAYVIVLGFDQRSSAGRKALGVGRTLIAAALGVVAVPQGGGNLFTAALIDAKTGDILWFTKTPKPYDLREPEEATKLALEFMMDLPALGHTP